MLQRTDFTGPALIRLLARLTDINVRESKQAFADRLSQWLSWTDAISLSAALNGNPATAPSGPQASGNAEESECTRVRTVLANAIAEDMRGMRAAVDTTTDFSFYRRRYVARQQGMEASIGALRGRLRAGLTARSAAMARLAAVDVVMEQVLDAHERSLLSTVPVVLEKHFKRLRQADSGVQPGEWLDVFRKDIQDVLLAELDFRFQPVEGLLEALRMRQPDCHD